MAKLTDVTGIGPVTANVLANHHIKTLEALATISITELEKIPGFSNLRAKAAKKAAVICLSKNTNTKTSATISSHTITKKSTDPGNVTALPAVTPQADTSLAKSGVNKDGKKEKAKNKVKKKIKEEAKDRKKNKTKSKKEKSKAKKKKTTKKS